MSIKVTALFMILLIIGSLITAQEPRTPADNWCFEGGAWDDGRCGNGTEYENKWHWTCGWYMARFEAGTFTKTDLPVTCQSAFGTDTDVVPTYIPPTPTPTHSPLDPTPTYIPVEPTPTVPA